MKAVETIAEARAVLDGARSRGRTVGFVPTMGFLHAGHRSLMERSAAECDLTFVTSFVNPTQFGAHEDLDAYPRDRAGDLALCEAAGVGLALLPSVEEMYPLGLPTWTTVAVRRISETLEGASRPGHFDGVATVVAKLFNIAGTCRAYFGEKDWQQLAVIRRMAADLDVAVEVVGCPTVREADGLALSSRNSYLTSEERAVAPLLHQALLAGRAAIEGGETSAAAVGRLMADRISLEPQMTLDYAEVVDADTLSRVDPLRGTLRLLVASRLGRARLIDNEGATAGPG
jgi:pantoate--beta-alanine ligase